MEHAKAIPALLRQIRSMSADPSLNDPDALRLALHQAVDESFTGAGFLPRGAAIVARLGRLLGMGHEELARIFRVSGETVRRWERGLVRIPDARLAELEAMAAAADRLEALLIPARIPQAIRRPAAIFQGETALEWIERGRMTEVADRYEIALSYQQ